MMATIPRARFIPALAVAMLILLVHARASAELRVGGAKVDITPDPAVIQTPLGGYAARKAAPSTGIHDRNFARALVFQQGATRTAVVSLDLCFVPATLKQLVCSRLAALGAPVDAEHLMLSATHSHTSPDPLAMIPSNTLAYKGWTPYSAPLTNWIVGRIAQSLITAAARLMPVRLGSAQRDCTGSNRNRRGEKIVDAEMNIVKITDLQGRYLAAIVNFAAHPTLYDDKMMQISADWPGQMCADLERRMGGDAVALFLNGAEGDASPNGAVGDTSEAKCAAFGRDLAGKAWDIMLVMQTSENSAMRAWRQPLALPPRKPNGLFIMAASTFGATMNQARQLVDKIMPTISTLGFVQMGDLLLITTPCEPTGELGLAIKAKARMEGYKQVGVVALTDDWIAYALMPEQYRAGNYEAGMSFYGETLGPTILDHVSTGLKAGSRAQ